MELSTSVPIPLVGSTDVSPEHYVGRFAPSPSGNLHFGSLITALASFLIARQRRGKWLLRIDDIDQPRCKPGMDLAIMDTLMAHGLRWDGEVLYQSKRLSLYQDVVKWLFQRDLVYLCECTRKQIKEKGEFYTGTCSEKNLAGGYLTAKDLAIRLRNPRLVGRLHDAFLGDIDIPKDIISEDFVLKRRDGIHGYHLVAVIDDIAQGITQVVRGADLLFPSACQSVLYSLFNATQPEFLHVPVAVSAPGRKLSKQNHSPPLDNARASGNLVSALSFLGASVPSGLEVHAPKDILAWAIGHWSWRNMTNSAEITVSSDWC